jgi:hypothetical protein
MACKTVRFLLLLFLPFAANADNHRLVVGYGVAGVLDDDTSDFAAVSYEFAERNQPWGIRPLLHAMVGEDSSYYIGFGGSKTWGINSAWSWGLSSMVGGLHVSSNHSLDHDVEFYTRLFADYKLNQQSSLRMEIGHISNAGLGDENPGWELVTFSWTRSM